MRIGGGALQQAIEIYKGLTPEQMAYMQKEQELKAQTAASTQAAEEAKLQTAAIEIVMTEQRAAAAQGLEILPDGSVVPAQSVNTNSITGLLGNLQQYTPWLIIAVVALLIFKRSE